MKHEDYTIGWVCALPLEAAAAYGMLDEQHDSLPSRSDDSNNYTYGRIGEHNVVVACLPYGVMGKVSAARVAERMLSTFSALRFALMVGIGGGVPSEDNDIRLGDIVVSHHSERDGGVIQYDYGKTIQEGRFVRMGSLNRPPDVLLTALATLVARSMMKPNQISNHVLEMIEKFPDMSEEFTSPGPESDILYSSEYDHPKGNPTCANCNATEIVQRTPRSTKKPVVHHGLIASGDQVMKHGVTRDRLREELDVICFEMEASGLMDAFPCLVIRGICDYSDSHKNKRWQPFAAATAAAYAKELLSVIPRTQVANTNLIERTTEGKIIPTTETGNRPRILPRPSSNVPSHQNEDNIDYGDIDDPLEDPLAAVTATAAALRNSVRTHKSRRAAIPYILEFEDAMLFEMQQHNATARQADQSYVKFHIGLFMKKDPIPPSAWENMLQALGKNMERVVSVNPSVPEAQLFGGFESESLRRIR